MTSPRHKTCGPQPALRAVSLKSRDSLLWSPFFWMILFLGLMATLRMGFSLWLGSGLRMSVALMIRRIRGSSCGFCMRRALRTGRCFLNRLWMRRILRSRRCRPSGVWTRCVLRTGCSFLSRLRMRRILRSRLGRPSSLWARRTFMLSRIPCWMRRTRLLRRARRTRHIIARSRSGMLCSAVSRNVVRSLRSRRTRGRLSC